MEDDDPGERLRAANRARHVALSWWRRFPWWIVLGIPIALAIWALQMVPLWALLAANIRRLAEFVVFAELQNYRKQGLIAAPAPR